jgi:hypothetical protein
LSFKGDLQFWLLSSRSSQTSKQFAATRSSVYGQWRNVVVRRLATSVKLTDKRKDVSKQEECDIVEPFEMRQPHSLKLLLSPHSPGNNKKNF